MLHFPFSVAPLSSKSGPRQQIETLNAAGALTIRVPVFCSGLKKSFLKIVPKCDVNIDDSETHIDKRLKLESKSLIFLMPL